VNQTTLTGCTEARAAIHRRLDGEALEAVLAAGLERHLAGCPGCRRAEAELADVQVRLRAVRLPPMPDADVRAVLARTSRAPRAVHAVGWRAAAVAAAVLLAVLLGSWIERTRRPDPIELARAANEARYVLALTGRALDRTERAAVGRVLAGEVSPALRRVPMKLPGAGESPKGDQS